MQEALPWLIDVQALAHPKLQPLQERARKVLVAAKYGIVAVGRVPATLQILQSKCSSAPWQARGGAVALLQCFWFR